MTVEHYSTISSIGVTQPPPLCAQTVCLGPQSPPLPPFTPMLWNVLHRVTERSNSSKGVGTRGVRSGEGAIDPHFVPLAQFGIAAGVVSSFLL